MFIAITTRPGGPESNLGWISVDRHAPVATYTFHTTAHDGSPVEAVLKGYSRWSEPAAALVARCLALLPRQSWLADKPHTGFLGVAISLGLDHDVAWPIERAYSWGHRGNVVVDWHDGDDVAEKVTVAGAVPEDLNAALLLTLRLGAWQADATPPVPHRCRRFAS